MLSDRDRTLLAPHLALLRAARRDLAAAQRAFDEAELRLAGSTSDTDWRDRRLGGLFSADDGRTRRFRQARDDHRAAERALTAARAGYTRYAERMDGLLEPMLTRDDPAYRARLADVRACDQALAACHRLQHRLAAVLTKPTPDARGSAPWHESELARQQVNELVAGLRTAVPALRRAIDRTARAVGEPHPPVLDAAALNGLDRAPAMVTDQHLRGLQRQLTAAAETLTRWRGRADQARSAALRAAHDTL